MEITPFHASNRFRYATGFVSENESHVSPDFAPYKPVIPQADGNGQ
jgi:hypothetical protein